MKSTAKQRNDLMMSKLQGIMLLSEDAAATNEQMSKEAKLKDDTKLYTAFRMMEGTFQPDTSGFFKKVLAGVLGGGKTCACCVKLCGRPRRARPSLTPSLPTPQDESW